MAEKLEAIDFIKAATRRWSSNSNLINVIAAVAMSCLLVIAFLHRDRFIISYQNLLSASQTHKAEPHTEPLLTISRQTELQRLVSDHLLSEGDTFNAFFRFLSLLDDNCSSLLIPEAQALANSPYFKKRSQEMQNKLATAGLVNEGFSGQVPGQVVFYVLLARQPWVRQICEIGFNAGHSALYWLTSSNRTKLLSFDLGAHSYTKIMADYMASAYPGRFQVVWGDSTKTVNEFVKKAQLSRRMLHCDVIVVDGGHNYGVAIADLRNMQAFVGSPRHLLLMDDTPCIAEYCDGPNKAWRELRNFIKPIFGCTNYPGVNRGFSVGYYVI